jgi:uncharacterized protein YaaN involved in tellurite resistance
MKLENFPFYQLARDLWLKVQEKQIVKGLHKYEEAFNPSNWTADELLNHALEESVDLVHYIVGLKVKNEELNRNIAFLKAELEVCKYLLKQKELEPNKPSYFDLDD